MTPLPSSPSKTGAKSDDFTVKFYKNAREQLISELKVAVAKSLDWGF